MGNRKSTQTRLQEINARLSFMVFTSNAGGEQLVHQPKMGFHQAEDAIPLTDHASLRQMMVEQNFAKVILDRLQIVPFGLLSREQNIEVIRMAAQKLIREQAALGLQIEIADLSAIAEDFIAEAAHENESPRQKAIRFTHRLASAVVEEREKALREGSNDQAIRICREALKRLAD